jgi:tRNA(Arg) A34 adenosine deaminase TadA
MTNNDIVLMRRALALAREGLDSNSGGPFGAVVARDGEVIGEGFNRVTSSNDPTAHAEVVAIREACRTLQTFQLDECVIYASCEPCPMCLGAIYWARAERVYIACTREDAAKAGFDDAFIYNEINREPQDRSLPIDSLLRDEGIELFSEWVAKPDKVLY